MLVLEPLLDGVVCPRCGAYCNRWKDKDRKLLINDWDIAAGGCIKVVVAVQKAALSMRLYQNRRSSSMGSSWSPGHQAVGGFCSKASEAPNQH